MAGSGDLVQQLLAYAARLRHPALFFLVLALFALNLITPDPLPLVDELLLGLMSLLLGTWRRPRPSPPTGRYDKPPEKNVTPPRDGSPRAGS